MILLYCLMIWLGIGTTVVVLAVIRNGLPPEPTIIRIFMLVNVLVIWPRAIRPLLLEPIDKSDDSSR